MINTPIPGSQPHLRFRYGTRFGLRHQYEVFRIPNGSIEWALVGLVPVDEPAYMHSFALAQRYAMLTEHPFTANSLGFLHPGRSFIDAYEWHSERGTQFVVLDRTTGEVVTYDNADVLDSLF